MKNVCLKGVLHYGEYNDPRADLEAVGRYPAPCGVLSWGGRFPAHGIPGPGYVPALHRRVYRPVVSLSVNTQGKMPTAFGQRVQTGRNDPKLDWFMIDTETARTKNVRAVLAKRQIFFARLKKRGADRYLFRRCKYDELYNKRYSSS